ncbi:hypothetical protein TNCV_5120751 [Trichonephila clavipes]|nr:hypothetical protein TNCV_5120751 [Trichonephila clavipes]
MALLLDLCKDFIFLKCLFGENFPEPNKDSDKLKYPKVPVPTPRAANSVAEVSQPLKQTRTATAGSDVVQSGRPIFDDFFQYLWPYIGNNTANVVFQMVKRFWLIRIDQ